MKSLLGQVTADGEIRQTSRRTLTKAGTRYPAGGICAGSPAHIRQWSLMRFRERLPAGGALLLCAFFFWTGLLFLPYPGAQYSELTFLAGMVRLEVAEFWNRLPWLGSVPTMLMPYLGALKALVYAPVFRIWGFSDGTLRLPVLLLGTASVWLFFLIMRRVAGAWAALSLLGLSGWRCFHGDCH